MTARSCLFLFVPLIMVAGCEQKPKLVYMPDGPLTVTLNASASASSVQQGDTVVLSVERRTTGNWKQVPVNEARGQCWFFARPPETEPQVADAVQWAVDPENSVTFNAEYRFDHARLATMNVKGTVRLTPVSEIPCEADRRVEGPTLEIVVQ
jgi:hypothetical protein